MRRNRRFVSRRKKTLGKADDNPYHSIQSCMLSNGIHPVPAFRKAMRRNREFVSRRKKIFCRYLRLDSSNRHFDGVGSRFCLLCQYDLRNETRGRTFMDEKRSRSNIPWGRDKRSMMPGGGIIDLIKERECIVSILTDKRDDGIPVVIATFLNTDGCHRGYGAHGIVGNHSAWLVSPPVPPKPI
jgi:hypothetical protein